LEVLPTAAWTLLLVSVPIGALVDFASIGAALTSINGEITAGRWDLLRLTPLHEAQLVALKHAAAQIRAWRSTVLVIGVRLIAFLLAALELVFSFFDSRSYIFALDDVFTFVYGHVLLGGVALVSLLEPVWRLRAVAALGMAVSARTSSVGTAGLAGGSLVFAFWLVQGSVAIALLMVLSMLLAPLVLIINTVMASAVITVVVVICIGVLYGLYVVATRWGLRAAVRRLIADERA
jgi:hypothetical protein